MAGIVLLTGATGFVGKQIYKSLVQDGIRVRLVLRGAISDEFLAEPCVESCIITNDMFAENLEWWESACHGVEAIIHAAWYVEPEKYLDSPKNIDCLIGTLNLARAAVMTSVKKFIGIGTCFEYDLNHNYLSIDTPVAPRSLYAGTKVAAFYALRELFKNAKIDFAWARLFYLYGEGEKENRFVPYLHNRLSAGLSVEMTSGVQIRDYLDVKTAGRMIADIACNNKIGPMNICSGVPVSIKDMACKIAEEYGRKDLLMFGAKSLSSSEPLCVVGVV